MTSEVHRHPNAEPAEPMAELAEPSAPWRAPAQQSHPAPPVDRRPASGPQRATGTAHVPDVALLPAHQLPMLPTPVPRVYGRPAPQAPVSPPVTAAPPTPYQPGPFQPTPTQPAPAQPTPFQPPQPQWPGTPTSPGPYQTGPEAVAPFGGHPVSPAPAPASARPDAYAPPPEPGNSNLGMLIAVGAVVLLAVVGLIAFMWPSAPSDQFSMGSCVKKSESEVAVPVECTAAGAYKIVNQVQRKEECEDQTQPHLELGAGKNRILCLVPATGGGAPTETQSAKPNPTTT